MGQLWIPLPGGTGKVWCDHSLCLATCLSLPRTKCLFLPLPSLPPSLLCPPFPLAALLSHSSLCSGPLGPVIIRKGGRRGAIGAHQGFGGSWDCVLGTWGCRGFVVFLLFQPRYLPTQADPAQSQGGAEPETRGFERRDTSRKMGVRECVCNRVYDRGVDGRCVVSPPPPDRGAVQKRVFLIGNSSPCQLWENNFSRDSLYTAILLPSPGPPQGLWSTFLMEGLGVGGQSLSKAFLPVLSTSAGLSGVCSSSESSHTRHRCGFFRLVLCHSRTLVLAFSWATLKGSLICLLAIFLPSPGDDCGL